MDNGYTKCVLVIISSEYLSLYLNAVNISSNQGNVFAPYLCRFSAYTNCTHGLNSLEEPFLKITASFERDDVEASQYQRSPSRETNWEPHFPPFDHRRQNYTPYHQWVFQLELKARVWEEGNRGCSQRTASLAIVCPYPYSV